MVQHGHPDSSVAARRNAFSQSSPPREIVEERRNKLRIVANKRLERTAEKRCRSAAGRWAQDTTKKFSNV